MLKTPHLPPYFHSLRFKLILFILLILTAMVIFAYGFMKHLQKLGYSGRLGCELFPLNDTKAAVRAIMAVKLWNPAEPISFRWKGIRERGAITFSGPDTAALGLPCTCVIHWACSAHWNSPDIVDT